MNFDDSIVDLSHHNGDVTSMHAAQAVGIKAILHKTGEGLKFVDNEYADRAKRAKSIGLHWGAYHFGAYASGAQQADKFLEIVGLGGDTLLCLDWESNPLNGTMSIEQAEAFVTQVRLVAGRYPVLYSGNAFLSAAPIAGASPLRKCPLWIARYGPHAPELRPPWKPWAMWQYSDGSDVPGLGKVDRSKFDLSHGTLADFWAGQGALWS